MDVVDVDPKPEENKEDKTVLVQESEEVKEEPGKSQFDPTLSTREMRKIKYYEDMFAKMANEGKQTQPEQTQPTPVTQTKTRTRVHDRKKTNFQKQEIPYSSLEEYKHDGIDQVYSTVSKTGKKQVFKKTTSMLELDYQNNKLNKNENLQTQMTDGKAILDNKRSIKVQSMPMVTKKPKPPLPPAVEPKPLESRPRRSKVSRWDVKTTFPSPPREYKPPPEMPVEEEKKVEEEVKSVPTQEFVGEEVYNEVDMEVEIANEEDTKQTEQPEETQETQQKEMEEEEKKEEEQVEVAQEQGDLPLDAEGPLEQEPQEQPAETLPLPLPQEFETNLEEQYAMEELQMHVPSKKKSNRGRKPKNKKTTPTNLYLEETNPELDTLVLAEYTPVSPESDFLEEVKPAPRQRPRSQRNRKKKEQYEGERPTTKAKSTPKSGKGVGRNHSGVGEKAERSQSGTNRRDFGELSEEKFISVENLRMITMEEAQKMISLSMANKVDLESLRNLMNKMCNDNFTNEVSKKRDATANRFLLDPANIVAPPPSTSQEENEPRVPEDPLQLSFKYRQFHDLNKF